MDDLTISLRLRRLSRLALFPHTIFVSPRVWREHGVVKNMLKTWCLVTAAGRGVPPDSRAKYYSDRR
jgi:hypothetical protein